MTPGIRVKLLSITLILFLAGGKLLADTLDHTLFIQEMTNSSDLIYQSCIIKYDTYLNNNPNDISVHIEKCKFIQFALYDEEEDYNPNQAAFDSCAAALIQQFPSHPEIFLFQITYLWGDELKAVFDDAEKAIERNPEQWSDVQLGQLYKQISYYYYSDSDLPLALMYMEKAIDKDTIYASSLDYARILIELDKRPEALAVLQASKDTSKLAWELNSKADLYLELKEYARALVLYNRIEEIDSTYNDKATIANTLEGVGEYLSARKYLVADTSTIWNKENALRKLLDHDLQYQDGAQCLATYNALRQYGFATDPLGLYRLKLFFLHPLQPWKFRDIVGLIALTASFLLLVIIPYIWILPIYFIGHRWNLVSRPKAYALQWGLIAFWFVSAGYVIASFVATWAAPDYLYSLLLSNYGGTEISQEKEGLVSILFVLLYAVVGLATLYRKNPKVLLSYQWPIQRCIFYGIAILVAYKFIVGIYVWVVVSKFGITMEDMVGMLSHCLATRQDVEAIIAVAGTGIGFILICIIVPLYEEIIFRGVILDASQRYLNFNAANFIQATLFAAIHMNLYLFPVFLLFGLMTGYMRKSSGGLLAGIVFHIINNILAISIMLIR